MSNNFLLIFRWSKSPQPLQQPPATEEKTKIAHGIHQSSNLRARKAFPLSKVSQPGRPRRNRLQPGPHQRPSDNMVPEPSRQAQTRHGGAQKRRGKFKNHQRAQKFPRKRARSRHSQEKSPDVRWWLRQEPSNLTREIARVDEEIVSDLNFPWLKGKRFPPPQKKIIKWNLRT